MPMCMFYTNLQTSDLPQQFETKLAQEIAKIFNKPMKYLNTLIATNQPMYRLESTSPACLLQIYSVGDFDKERNPTYTPPLVNFLTAQLKIDRERIVIMYLRLESYDLGFAA